VARQLTKDRHEDGTIRLWDRRTESLVICFNGHKSAVTHLAFDNSGVKLASGSKDTDIIIWDLISEVGLIKLRGHKDQIVGLEWLYPQTEEDKIVSDSGAAFILSASKDSTIKLWDLESKHCLETHVAQTNGECWSMGVTPDKSGCITAGNGGELKVWSIDVNGLSGAQRGENFSADRHLLRDRGILLRQSKDITTEVRFHPQSDYFAVHGSQKALEIWKIRTEDEVRRILQRRQRRRREKGLTNGESDTAMTNGHDGPPQPGIEDYFAHQTTVRTTGKVGSFDWIDSRSRKAVQVLVASANNSLEVYDIPTRDTRNEEAPEYTRSFLVDVPGHRTDVRGISLSSDDRMLATASNGLLKIWNVRTGACLRTMECGYSLCCAFLPGDKIVMVGSKSGEVELFDISSSVLIEKFQAHDASIWSLQVHPNGKSCVTGGADKVAKFWDFDIIQEEIPGTGRSIPRLKLTHTRSLKVNDDILSLCFSPDSRLLAVSTLDNTVKIFFTDSLKLFLNLYGHKLPVVGMSISSDSKLIATSSADKNIRLWGLDFGDCHKALFGHSDTIMAVNFIPQPPSTADVHFLFSVSKDRTVKTWDGDKFEQVQKLSGHHGEIWAMAMSNTGEFFVTASHDKSIRIWSLTDDLIFLEEEREREMEELYDQTLTTSLDADENFSDDNEDRAVAPHKQTVESLTAGEKIMEALELGMDDLNLVQEWERQRATNPKVAPPQRDTLYLAMGNISAERHVLGTVTKIPAAQLQDALLVLPFSTLPALFTFIAIWVKNQWEIPVVCRILYFMLKTHQKQIVSSRELKNVLADIRRDLRATLGEIKDVIGYNVAALQRISEKVKERSETLIEDVEEDPLARRKKRTFVDVA
jgi:U3 small nucleolar RNA-associated protein 12